MNTRSLQTFLIASLSALAAVLVVPTEAQANISTSADCKDIYIFSMRGSNQPNIDDEYNPDENPEYEPSFSYTPEIGDALFTNGWEGATIQKLLDRYVEQSHMSSAAAHSISFSVQDVPVVAMTKGEYPATVTAFDPGYGNPIEFFDNWDKDLILSSVSAGTESLSGKIEDIISDSLVLGCNEPSFVLIGYSQGAMVARMTAYLNPQAKFIGIALIGDPYNPGLASDPNRYAVVPGSATDADTRGMFHLEATSQENEDPNSMGAFVAGMNRNATNLPNVGTIINLCHEADIFCDYDFVSHWFEWITTGFTQEHANYFVDQQELAMADMLLDDVISPKWISNNPATPTFSTSSWYQVRPYGQTGKCLGFLQSHFDQPINGTNLETHDCPIFSASQAERALYAFQVTPYSTHYRMAWGYANNKNWDTPGSSSQMGQLSVRTNDGLHSHKIEPVFAKRESNINYYRFVARASTNNICAGVNTSGSVVFETCIASGSPMDRQLFALAPQSTDFTNTTPDTAPPPPPPAIPDTPSDLSVSTQNFRSITVGWQAPTGATTYEVRRSSSHDGVVTTFTGITNTLKFDVLDHHQLVTYGYSVRACNSGGCSPWSDEQSIYLPDTLRPSIPTHIDISETHDSVSLTWEPSTDNVGVTGYRLFRDSIEVGIVSSLSFVDNDLQPDSFYVYEIEAFDAAGNVSWRNERYVYTLPAPPAPDTTPPTVPTDLTVWNDGRESINIYWSLSTDEYSGSGFSHYELWRDGSLLVSNSVESWHSDTDNLVPGQSYLYQVKAIDQAGNASELSSGVYGTAGLPLSTTPPEVPTGLTATVYGGDAISLNWQPGIHPEGYEFIMEVFRNGIKIGEAPYGYFLDDSVVPETEYAYSVRAVDVDGQASAFTSEVVVTTALTDTEAPSTPADFAIDYITDSQVWMSWSQAQDDVGVRHYEIYRDGNLLGTTSSNEYRDYSVQQDEYTYSVKSVDYAGNVSGQSSEQIVTVPVYSETDTIAPSRPMYVGLYEDEVNGHTVVWGYSVDNVGVTEYEVYRDGILVSTVATNSFIDATLEPEVSYQFTIVALDAAGNRSATSRTTNITVIGDDGEGDDGSGGDGDGGGGWVPPPPPTVDPLEVADALAFIQSQLGDTVANGAAGPDSWGASELIAAAYAEAGVYLPSESVHDLSWYGLMNGGWLQYDNVEVGDILFTYGNVDIDGTQHPRAIRAGFYIGNNSVIEAHTDGTVRVVENFHLEPDFYQWEVIRPSALGEQDVVVPSVPAFGTEAKRNRTAIELTWSFDQNDSSLAGYELFRNGVLVEPFMEASAGRYVDYNLEPDTEYTYEMRAFDTGLNRSALSAPIVITTREVTDIFVDADMANSVIGFYQDQLGKVQSVTGNGPDEWSASALAQEAFSVAQARMFWGQPAQWVEHSHQHHIGYMNTYGQSVNSADRAAGDLLFYLDPVTSEPYHSALYIGNGKMIEAINGFVVESDVRTTDLAPFAARFTEAGYLP